jgi:hypothetical protein
MSRMDQDFVGPGIDDLGVRHTDYPLEGFERRHVEVPGILGTAPHASL